MIVGNSLRRLMSEQDMDLELLSQASGLSLVTLKKITEGKSITVKNLDILCKTLRCQPCDIIEYIPDDKPEPHWEWVI